MFNRSFFFIILIFLTPFIFLNVITSFVDFYILSFLSLIILFFLKYLFVVNEKSLNIIIFFQFIYSFFCLFIFNQAMQTGHLNEDILVGDQLSYFTEALAFFYSSLDFSAATEQTNINYSTYQYILSQLFNIGNTPLLVSLMLSVMLSAFSLLFISASLQMYLSSKYTNLVLLLVGFLPHYMAASIGVYKDIFIVFSFVLLLYSSCLIFDLKKNKLINLFLFLFSLIIIFFFRFPFLFLYIIFVVYVFLISKFSFLNIIISFLLIITTINIFEYRGLSSKYLDSSTSLNSYLFERSTDDDLTIYGDGVTSALVANHKNWSVLKRIYTIPVVSVVQYFNPFNFFDFNHKSVWSYIDVNYKLIWVLLFGPFIIFCFLNFQKIQNNIFKKLLIFSLFGCVFIAYSYGGLIPRYALVFYVAALISSGFILQELDHNKKLSINFYKFFKIYYAFLSFLILLYLIYKF